MTPVPSVATAPPKDPREARRPGPPGHAADVPDLGSLQALGWARVPCGSSEQLHRIASLLGGAVTAATVEARQARGRGDNSLSGRHGRGGLPPHTDGATQPLPPRWLVMRCRTPTATPTLLFDAAPVVADPDHAHELGRPWLVTPGGSVRPFYAPVFQRTPGGWFVRLNTACMTPTRHSRGDAHLRLLGGERVEHRWEPGEALVFSNRRFLHARGPVLDVEVRTIERLAVR